MPTPREEYQSERKILTHSLEAGEVSQTDHDAIIELVDAYDEHKTMVTPPTDENGRQSKYREPLTLANWVRRLKIAAQQIDLTDATRDDVNQLSEWLLEERENHAGEAGLAKNTVRTYQDTLRVFYRYHDFGPDPENINVYQQEESTVDPHEMLTPEEISELRKACGHARDQALFDFMLFTGQRSAAVRTLRLKDVDLENQRFRLNDTVDGLKNANKYLEWRALLVAERSLTRWIQQHHPAPNDPDAYVFTAKGIYNEPNPRQPLNRNVPQRLMDRLKDRTEIEKPMHPHMLRHNFVNIALNWYDTPPEEVKLHIGHTPGSRVMETTYRHLKDEDVQKKMEQSFGITEPEDDDGQGVIEVCDCGEPLAPDAKACPGCGTLLTPDARSARDMATGGVQAAKEDAETLEEHKKLDRIERKIRENPELLEVLDAEVLESLGALVED